MSDKSSGFIKQIGYQDIDLSKVSFSVAQCIPGVIVKCLEYLVVGPSHLNHVYLAGSRTDTGCLVAVTDYGTIFRIVHPDPVDKELDVCESYESY